MRRANRRWNDRRQRLVKLIEELEGGAPERALGEIDNPGSEWGVFVRGLILRDNGLYEKYHAVRRQAESTKRCNEAYVRIYELYDAYEEAKGGWEQAKALAEYIFAMRNLSEEDFRQRIVNATSLTCEIAGAKLKHLVTILLAEDLKAARNGDRVAFERCEKAFDQFGRYGSDPLGLLEVAPDDWANIVVRYVEEPRFPQFRRKALPPIGFWLLAARTKMAPNLADAMFLLAQWVCDPLVRGVVPESLVNQVAGIAVDLKTKAI